MKIKKKNSSQKLTPNRQPSTKLIHFSFKTKLTTASSSLTVSSNNTTFGTPKNKLPHASPLLSQSISPKATLKLRKILMILSEIMKISITLMKPKAQTSSSKATSFS